MKTTKQYSPEIKERAVRLVQEQQAEYPSTWAAISSIASKIGCTPETLRSWVKHAEQHQADGGHAAAEHKRLKQLEREVRELKRANEILRKAAAFFAQAELDRK